jgi:hypothetical protein
MGTLSLEGLKIDLSGAAAEAHRRAHAFVGRIERMGTLSLEGLKIDLSGAGR